MKSSDFELLLPVGQKEMAEAAIHNGADAIYVGFPGWNARGRSYDFELEELRQIIENCHLYGVKVNLAFNIVIFENELPQVIAAIKRVLPLKPDALIVQDIGLVHIVKEMCPEQVVHASTQMTITNDLAIELLNDLQIRRFVLGRENSLDEIKLIAERSKKELEVFVHGALCVSYSGQCFTSETLGGRSANRGQCAQSCRFSYDLIVDGEKKNLVDKNYLVSPQDLCGIAEIPELMKLGVKSFKIEGRLKSPDYVAQAAKSYRAAIDSVLNENRLSNTQLAAEKKKMSVEYSRGFYPGWLHGVNHQELVPAGFSSHRGYELGRIVETASQKMYIKLREKMPDVENGDGLLWFENGEKKGGNIYSVRSEADTLIVEFANSVRLSGASSGGLVYLNHDRSQKREIEKSMTDKNVKKRIEVSLSLKLQEGEPLRAILTDGRRTLELSSSDVLNRAQNKPLTEDLLFEEMSALGGTIFSLPRRNFKLEMQAETSLFLNHKAIKNLRQSIFSQLSELRANNKIEYSGEVAVNEPASFVAPKPALKRMKFNVLVRNKEQVQAIIDSVNSDELKAGDVSSICLDFEFGRDYKNSVEALRQVGLAVGIATTRILKPQEYVNLKVIHSLNPDFILVRNLGALYYFKGVQEFSGLLRGDFSLNVTNHRTFNYLLEKGLHSICLSYDMNYEQSISLLESVDAGRAEMTIHQSMPSFHMEHCVFAAFLSKGSSFRDCGKPCEKHQVQLRDQFGNMHWIKPDHECRNTMYNASAQTALPYLHRWKTAGLGEIRFEALHESPVELISKLKSYVGVLNESLSVDTALAELKTKEVYGLSPQQLARSDEYQARKKDHSFL